MPAQILRELGHGLWLFFCAAGFIRLKAFCLIAFALCVGNPQKLGGNFYRTLVFEIFLLCEWKRLLIYNLC